MFEKLVIGFDGTTQGHDALALGRALAAERSRVVVVCVHPVQLVSARVGPTGAVGPRAEAEERLKGARAALEDRPGTEFVTVPASSAAAGLHAIAEAEGADLVVVGSSHRGPVGRVLPGTTSAQVLQAAPCAVATAPFDLHVRGAFALREIGVGYDGGEESRHALRAAVALAAEHGARLRVIAVADTSTWALGMAGGYVWPEYRDDVLAVTNEHLDDAVAELGELVPVERRLLEGHPAHELRVASEELDLLVLGSRAYGPVRRLLLGSVAAAVAADAACPLLVYPRSAG